MDDYRSWLFLAAQYRPARVNKQRYRLFKSKVIGKSCEPHPVWFWPRCYCIRCFWQRQLCNRSIWPIRYHIGCIGVHCCWAPSCVGCSIRCAKNFLFLEPPRDSNNHAAWKRRQVSSVGSAGNAVLSGAVEEWKVFGSHVITRNHGILRNMPQHFKPHITG